MSSSSGARRSGTKPGSGYVPDRGDVVWLDFDPRAGHEQGGHRPAVVLSHKDYNATLGLMLACPMTRQGKGYPFEVACEVGGSRSFVLCDQVKSVDWRARGARFERALPAREFDEVMARVASVLGLELGAEP